MTACRVCSTHIGAPSYEAPAPALTSGTTLLDVPTRVFVCGTCGHAQSDDIPDIQAFYDTEYRISLSSENHDQIFAVAADGTITYRTDHQAALSLRLLDLPEGASILDYGAAKADTLRKMAVAREDLRPHVFEVSSDYAPAWQGWVPEAAQATYSVPEAWRGTFDAVMSHFVIEHVADPIGFMRDVHDLLRADGTFLFSIPDVAGNPGDMAVADHLNHFSEASLAHALASVGFELQVIDSTSFPGAFFVVAKRAEATVEAAHTSKSAADAAKEARDICAFWDRASETLAGGADRYAKRKVAIYGAGFYGSWIYCRIGQAVDVVAFLDRNENMKGATHFGIPVLSPEDLPAEAEALFIGLNPLKARAAIAAQPWLQRPGLDHVWL
ncbi:class I SAM-dependent methyltransferase [Ensifer sp. SL37]|uniref:class I SAM-dependent methyltransferase n=1 Tax=Ensifer sp. SL37 TaxID=2995137 RepID=UPI002275EDB2|nr:methyltransferase domain-containing protein [Ensifer sp. SL37]MCY1743390.1 methyltransferase domain-containing protein [Ensifer sp. SL37]